MEKTPGGHPRLGPELDSEARVAGSLCAGASGSESCWAWCGERASPATLIATRGQETSTPATSAAPAAPPKPAAAAFA